MKICKEYKVNGYVRVGNPNGTFEEKEQFLTLLMNNRKADSDNLFQEFMLGMPWSITRKYLKNFCSLKRKDRRVNKILKNGGYTEEGFLGNQIVTIMDYNKRQLELETSMKLLWLENEKLEAKKVQMNLESEESEKARQEKWLKDYVIKYNCSECGKEIAFPLLPEVDTDKSQELVGNIYKIVQQDIQNGIKYCSECETRIVEMGNWRRAKILKDLEEIKEQAKEDPEAVAEMSKNGFICIQIDLIDFCEKYRYDKKIKSLEQTKKALKDIYPEKDLYFVFVNVNGEPSGKVKDKKNEPLVDIYETVELSESDKIQRYLYVRCGEPEKFLEAIKWLETKIQAKEPAVETQQVFLA
jgi:hypothetical protein